MLVGCISGSSEKYVGYAIASVINVTDKLLVGLKGNLSLTSPTIELFKKLYPDKFFVYSDDSGTLNDSKNKINGTKN